MSPFIKKEMSVLIYFVSFLVNFGEKYPFVLFSTPMGVDYVVTGFDMEVQPLVTDNAA